jgi:hypothetical protein
MNLDEFKAEYVKTVQIELGDGGDFVTLREPTGIESTNFGAGRDTDGLAFYRLFPSLIVDHSFTFKKKDGTEEKAKAQAVAEMLYSRNEWVAEIVKAWNTILFYPSEKGKESATSSE